MDAEAVEKLVRRGLTAVSIVVARTRERRQDDPRAISHEAGDRAAEQRSEQLPVGVVPREVVRERRMLGEDFLESRGFPRLGGHRP
ncbi:hypothetical protein [Engelhardtia mirabilis]|uniref:hypothetical protein n=1 Tax=Engelhardtia mirabilis TaxID=2528011 RepID=UPI003AF3738E